LGLVGLVSVNGCGGASSGPPADVVPKSQIPSIPQFTNQLRQGTYTKAVVSPANQPKSVCPWVLWLDGGKNKLVPDVTLIAAKSGGKLGEDVVKVEKPNGQYLCTGLPAVFRTQYAAFLKKAGLDVTPEQIPLSQDCRSGLPIVSALKRKGIGC
jgi:hypothetical protein